MRVVADAIVQYMTLKSMVCRIDGGPSDCIPMIDVAYVDGERQLVALTGHPHDQVGPAIETVRAMRPVAEVVVLCEGIVGVLPTGSPPPPHGELMRRNEDCDPSTQTALTAYAVDAEGHTLTVTVPYGYGDDGMPWFSRPRYDAHAVGGVLDRAVEAMR